jgi:flagellar biosynthesis GTPase FlhF
LVAAGTSKDSYKVRECFWNGELVSGPVVLDENIQNGGTLRFVMDSEPNPMQPYDVNALTQPSAPVAAVSNTGNGADSNEAAAQARAELETFKRSSVALTGSLQEQVETYSNAAEKAEARAKELEQELLAEKQARSTETANLQAAIQEQSREVKRLESSIEAFSSSSHEKGGEGSASPQELALLKASLEKEINERQRTTILLEMLQDHNERLTSLNEVALSTNSNQASSSSSSSMLEYISYFGFLMALFGCVWALSSSTSTSRFRRAKDTSHIV